MTSDPMTVGSVTQTITQNEPNWDARDRCKVHPSDTDFPMVPGQIPTVDWSCMDLYRKHFSKNQPFLLQTGKNEAGETTAALPLLRKIAKRNHGYTQSDSRLWNRLTSPTNPWMKTGDLFYNIEKNDHHAIAGLANSLRQMTPSLIDVPWVNLTETWSEFHASLQDVGCQVFRQHQFDVGIIDTSGDWDKYMAMLGKSHRKSIRRNLNRCQKIGETRLERLTNFESRADLRIQLLQAFEISHRGWKGKNGSSVLSHDGMLDFYTDVAWNLSKRKLFELQFLNVAGQRIAFEYGYRHQGTYFSHKVGYDQQFAKYGPGQLLMYLQLQHWFSSDEILAIDTVGIVSEATAKWKPVLRPLYRYLIGTSGLPAQWVRFNKIMKPTLRRLLKRNQKG